MKLTAFLLLATCMQLAARTNGQIVTLKVKNAPVKEVFREIQKQTGLNVMVDEALLEKTGKVTLDVHDMPVPDVLNLCLKNEPLTYSIIDGRIVIKPKIPVTAPATVIINDQPPPIDIHGRVSDENGNPVLATIGVKGTSKGTITNDRGEFNLTNIDPNAVLIVTGVGIETVETNVNGRTNINIVARIAVKHLDETIIKGYYNTTRRLNTGTVEKVTGEEIARSPVSDPLSALQGRVPGLFIAQQNGFAGSNINVTIRGKNSFFSGSEPLYIIDGVPFLQSAQSFSQVFNASLAIRVGSPFNSINVNDIESIEVLKDADATAIYGSRGANGVILITTKKAKENRTAVDIDFSTGWGAPTRLPKMMNNQQYVAMRREAFANDNATPVNANAYDFLVWDSTRNNNWQKIILPNNTKWSNGQLRFSGGNSFTKFTLATGYKTETNPFASRFTDNRVDVNMNVNHRDISNKFSISLTTTYDNDKNKVNATDLSVGMFSAPPTAPYPFDASGKLIWNEKGFTFSNPLAKLFAPYSSTMERLTNNLQLSYKPVRFVTLTGSFGYNRFQFDEAYSNPIAAQNPALNPKGSAQFSSQKVSSWIAEPQAAFNHDIGAKGKMEVLLGGSLQRSETSGNIITATGYVNDALLQSTAGAASTSVTSLYTLYKYIGAYGRLHYSYNEKYIINFTGRRDGSSRFGPGLRFSNFGAIGAAWVFSKEKFMENGLSFISFGKIRGSYGVTGSDAIGDYQYLDTYTPSTYPYQSFPGLLPSGLFNDKLAWERIRKLELAVDFGFAHDKVLLSVNLFKNRSDNQVMSTTLPTQTGFNYINENLGGVIENKGIEISLTTTNMQRKDFSWKSAFNISITRNRLVNYPSLSTSAYADVLTIGKPVTSLRGYHYTGVDPQTGVYTFTDINNDGLFDNRDYVYQGTTDPKFYGGFENDFRYRNWQLAILLQFVSQKGREAIKGVQIYGTTNINAPVQLLNRWRKPGDVTEYQKFTQNFGSAAGIASGMYSASDAFYTDASYMRVKNVELSYTIPAGIANRIKARAIRLYVQAQNLLTFTKFKGSDPETQLISRLPTLRIINTGIKITF